MHELFLKFKCSGVITYQNHITVGQESFIKMAYPYRQQQCFSLSFNGHYVLEYLPIYDCTYKCLIMPVV